MDSSSDNFFFRSKRSRFPKTLFLKLNEIRGSAPKNYCLPRYWVALHTKVPNYGYFANFSIDFTCKQQNNPVIICCQTQQKLLKLKSSLKDWLFLPFEIHDFCCILAASKNLKSWFESSSIRIFPRTTFGTIERKENITRIVPVFDNIWQPFEKNWVWRFHRFRIDILIQLSSSLLGEEGLDEIGGETIQNGAHGSKSYFDLHFCIGYLFWRQTLRSQAASWHPI